LQDIVRCGISSEIAKHEKERQRKAKTQEMKKKVTGIKNSVLSIRVRNPFFSKG